MTDDESTMSGNTSTDTDEANEERLHANINHYGLRRLTDTTAIVTGSTRGIGEGIARRFASEGATVVVSGRTVEDGETIVENIQDVGDDAVFMRADMADPNDIERLIEMTRKRYGEIDVLVNNAAAWRHGPFTERTIDDWSHVIDVSLRAPWLATKHVLGAMPAGGSVINISSIHALATDPGRFPYNVAKAGLNGMTRSLAVDLSPLEISVNAIMPGPIRIRGPISDEGSGRMAHLLPANRRGKPTDVAGLAAYLASDEAGFVTGASIPVDGGWTACLFDDINAYNNP
jgi:glucose 1-dehydrogenase